jgi:hypothetical protein
MLIQEGWENTRRIHGTIVHAEIRNDKIWIHYDGIEDSVTEELVAIGTNSLNYKTELGGTSFR